MSSAAAASVPDPATALTFQELSSLNARKSSLKASHTLYLASHPEVASMLNDFLAQVLLARPDDVYAFAGEHFGELSPSDGVAGRTSLKGHVPVVVCGPRGVGKGTLLALLTKAFPGEFALAVSHTTRAQRAGEEEGEDYHFTTRDKMTQEVEDGKFIEVMEVNGNMYVKA